MGKPQSRDQLEFNKTAQPNWGYLWAHSPEPWEVELHRCFLQDEAILRQQAHQDQQRAALYQKILDRVRQVSECGEKMTDHEAVEWFGRYVLKEHKINPANIDQYEPHYLLALLPEGAENSQAEPEPIQKPSLTKAKAPKITYTAEQLESAIKGYLNKHTDAISAARDKKPGALDVLKRILARKTIEAELNIRSESQISQSPAYRAIKAEFGLERATSKPKRDGFTKTIRNVADDSVATPDEEAAKNEMITLAQKELSPQEADPIVTGLKQGSYTPEQAREIIKLASTSDSVS